MKSPFDASFKSVNYSLFAVLDGMGKVDGNQRRKTLLFTCNLLMFNKR